MKLCKIEVAGFRGVREQVCLDVPSGFIVLVGRNGSGKSTLCDAIEFALTGAIRERLHKRKKERPYKEKGESYADYVWWRGRGIAKRRFVRLTFAETDGSEFAIERTPAGLSDASGAFFERFYLSDCAPEEPIASMCRTSLLRDEEITSLSVDLPEAERYRFVRDALGSVTASSLEARLKDTGEALQKRVNEYQREYDKIRARISDLTTRLSDTQAVVTGSVDGGPTAEELESLFGAASGADTDMTRLGRSMLSEDRIRTDQVLNVLARVQSLEELLAEVDSVAYEQRLNALEEAVEAASQEYDAVSMELDDASELVSALRESEPEKTRLAEILELGGDLGTLSSGRCPLCGSEVSEEEFSSHISNSLEAITKHNATLFSEVERVSAVALRERRCKAALNEAKAELDSHRTMKEAIEEELAEATTDAQRIGCTTDTGPVTATALRAFLEQLRERTSRMEKAVAWLESSSLSELVESLRQELRESKKSSEVAAYRLARAEESAAKATTATKTVRTVLGEVVDEQLAELSPLIEELYMRLRPHVEWTQIRYRLRGTVRRMLSFEVGDGLNPSFVFSSGQRRAAGLAFLLSVHLSRPWCKWDSLILDDPVQHVDDYRALNLAEVLSAVRKSGRQVMCSVEDDALAQLLCRRLRGNAVLPWHRPGSQATRCDHGPSPEV